MESSGFSRIKNGLKNIFFKDVKNNPIVQKVGSLIEGSISGSANILKTGIGEKGKKIIPSITKAPVQESAKKPTLSKDELDQLPTLNNHIDRKIEEVHNKYEKPLKLSKEINTNKGRIETIKAELKTLLIGKNDGSNNFDRVYHAVTNNQLPLNFLSEATYKKSSSQTSEISKLKEELSIMLTHLETTREKGQEDIKAAVENAESALMKLNGIIETLKTDFNHSLDLEHTSKKQEIENFRNEALENFSIFEKILDMLFGWLKQEKNKINEEFAPQLLALEKKFKDLRTSGLKTIDNCLAEDFVNAKKPLEKVQVEVAKADEEIAKAIDEKRGQIEPAEKLDVQEQEKMNSISKKFGHLKALMNAIESNKKDFTIKGKLSKAVRLAREGKTSAAIPLLKQDLATIAAAGPRLLKEVEDFKNTLAAVKDEMGTDEFLQKTFGSYIKECEDCTTKLANLESISKEVATLSEPFNQLSDELIGLEKIVADKIVQFNEIAEQNELRYKAKVGSDEENTNETDRNDAIYRGYSPSLDHADELRKWTSYKNILAEGAQDQHSAEFVETVKYLISQMG